MHIEQITFRVDIEGEHRGAFVHLIDNEAGCFSVKIGDLVMSLDEFSAFVAQLEQICNKIVLIEGFARNVES
jgi:hypothetical protein